MPGDEEDEWTCRKACAALLDTLSEAHPSAIEPIIANAINHVLNHGESNKYEQMILLIGIAQRLYMPRSDLLNKWFSFLIEHMEHTVRTCIL